MSNVISPVNQPIVKASSLAPLFNVRYSRRESARTSPSLISVDPHSVVSHGHLTPVDHDGQPRVEQRLHSNNRLYQSVSDRVIINERSCSITQMLHAYVQKADETKSNQILHNIFNVLELHFNAYADEKRQIYFEGLFQILHDFKEQVPEILLIETMQSLKVILEHSPLHASDGVPSNRLFLQIDPSRPFDFEPFILILWNLPRYQQDFHPLFDIFHELDHNKDLYITFDDIRSVLPHLTAHFDEEIVQAAIHVIDADHDNDRLSYFDFVTSLIALEECKLMMKAKTKPIHNGLQPRLIDKNAKDQATSFDGRVSET